MVNDLAAFLDYRRKLTVDLNNGDSVDFDIILNIPTGLYYRIISNAISLDESKDVNYQIDSILNTTFDILQMADRRITIDWIVANISIENQMEIITTLMNEVNKILEKECFKIPDLEVKKPVAKSDSAKEKEKTKTEIERLQSIIGNRFINLMDDIAIVTTKTSNDYNAIMDMPIFIFKDLTKTIVLNELRSDDDVNLAYLNYIFKRLNSDLNNSGNKEKADVKPRSKLTGANKNKLLAMLG